ncbi:hypothetical protein F0562_031169 [Nyssa sinensis]|uniref:Uncharacterized protein n=1 Tax=Nyssa sinensis TaxID=561372 RepID=A0A5J5ASW4_9ASTE|nr:hypothetical protein F0562_031169 [Nyssa sinensis]
MNKGIRKLFSSAARKKMTAAMGLATCYCDVEVLRQWCNCGNDGSLMVDDDDHPAGGQWLVTLTVVTDDEIDDGRGIGRNSIGFPEISRYRSDLTMGVLCSVQWWCAAMIVVGSIESRYRAELMAGLFHDVWTVCRQWMQG